MASNFNPPTLEQRCQRMLTLEGTGWQLFKWLSWMIQQLPLGKYLRELKKNLLIQTFVPECSKKYYL